MPGSSTTDCARCPPGRFHRRRSPAWPVCRPHPVFRS